MGFFEYGFQWTDEKGPPKHHDNPIGYYTSGRHRPRARYEIDGPDQSTLDQSNGGKLDPRQALLSTNNGPKSSKCLLRRVIRVLDPTDLAFSPLKDFTPNPSIIRRHTNYPSFFY
ncbi:Uncharacterized protein Fot_57485 [Forsythia ovata]|uniref:Uncharacterized protein n=1 Tax=Forsythia ovata TaxID=205694 RepID=A0ABD1NVV0_9LAMI